MNDKKYTSGLEELFERNRRSKFAEVARLAKLLREADLSAARAAAILGAAEAERDLALKILKQAEVELVELARRS